ncbi:reticulon-3 isoform X4 [Callorhinchus milii]|uniref:reticulon-3 isoform X4 n=1 Tax=Callorhinchus milii TaxID=7868 RepID=UPI001C3F9927|nr:reticulon-3 isoform X4 [Callorhinchus milii]
MTTRSEEEAWGRRRVRPAPRPHRPSNPGPATLPSSSSSSKPQAPARDRFEEPKSSGEIAGDGWMREREALPSATEVKTPTPPFLAATKIAPHPDSTSAPQSTGPVAETRGKGRESADESFFSPPSVAPECVMQSSAVVDLIYWRDIKKTGLVFGASLFLLLSMTIFSIVSVIAYLALALLSVTVSFRIYKGVLQAVQKSDDGHPFKGCLETDVTVSEDLIHKYSDVGLGHVNRVLTELRRLFLVQDLVDSLKFSVLMWLLTYVGALFNGLTLLIIALVAVFSIPVVYERHQTQIDHYIGMVSKQVKEVTAKIQAKVPGLKRKPE